MEQDIKTIILKIDGMTCNNCENRIQRELNRTEGILDARVSFVNSTAEITFDANLISMEKIESIIEELGYQVVKNADSEKKDKKVLTVLGSIAILYALYTIMKYFGFTGIFNIFPQVNENMGYGVLFVIGLMTSFHCIAMCGGINLSQCMNQGKEQGTAKGRIAVLMPGLLYNTGRVISYTVIGGIVGAAGSVFKLSNTTQGLIQIIAGIFMVIMGFNMLNIFPWLRKFNLRMPSFIATRIQLQKRNRGPFLVGLLNGLMPCGPLQAMQLYALSTGNPIKGALSMLLFSLGTVPLMFLLGAISSFLSKKFARKMVTAGAVLVVVLGITMFSRGLSLTGYAAISVPGIGNQETNTAVVSDDIQTVTTTLSSGGYEPITVKAGIPVKWTIKAEKGSLNGCNYKIVIPKFGIEKELQQGDNVIEFTPTESGKFAYSCWMGMIRSSITVTDENGTVASDQSTEYKIPTENIAVAEMKDGQQIITTGMKGTEFSPSVIVVQKDVPTTWTINLESDNGNGNAIVGFPTYNQQLTITEGENVINLSPKEDFEFSANDNSFFGYVKVVDDISKVDLEAIKKEISQYKPTGWDSSSAGGCCSAGAGSGTSTY